MSVLNHKNLVRIGYISRHHGYAGDVLLVLEQVMARSLQNTHFFFLEIQRKPVPFLVEQYTPIDSYKAIVRFEDVTTERQARTLSRLPVYLPVTELAERDVRAPLGLIGFQLIDEQYGIIGVIEDIVEMPQQRLARINYQNREVLIPLNDAIIIRTDKKQKQIYTHVPEGLLEL